MSFQIPASYELVKTQELPEIQSVGFLLSHKKSKARILCVENSDENKVFSIAFRTTPEDSTGVAHIIEHTVLCGSDKYPAKDPFVELVKGSLNTFLNAMTYPDKTVFPVASCNDKDFKNLMSVYMDAVLHPNIYKNKMLFEQEGWHYEMEDEDSPLIYNGVVYNEMKGAYSSPDDVLQEQISKALYPDNAYANDSGGYPVDIPDLTYEQFLDFHRKYYHPSNSYIYLFGNMDMEERLEWLDKEYLSQYEAITLDSEVKLQKPFEEVRYTKSPYSITVDEEEKDNTFLSWNKVVGNTLDAHEYMAFQVLEYVLLDAPGAPVKQALVDAGIGADIYGGYNSYLRQPYFGVVAKGANEEQQEQFVQIIEDTLKKLAEEGIAKKSLLASINGLEFKSREADFGSYPRGLMYGLEALNTWLYDDNAAMDTFAFDEVFEFLKKAVDTDYFEKLITDKLLHNTHGAVVCMVPKKGYSEQMETELADKLSAVRESLSESERAEIAEHTKVLKRFQDTPSTEEELEKIPLLQVSDIDKKTAPLYITEKEIGGITALHHDLFSNGIAYVNYEFDCACLTLEEIPYASLLRSLLGMVDTENYTYQELGDEVLIKTGGISSALQVYNTTKQDVLVKLEVSLKALYSQLGDGMELLDEIMLRSKYTDKKRIKEIVSQGRARLSSWLMGRGDAAAMLRAGSYYAKDLYITDLKGGIAFYQFLEDLDIHFEEKADALIEKLQRIAAKVFVKENLIISFTADKEGYELFKPLAETSLQLLPSGNPVIQEWKIDFKRKNEGFKTASQVNFVARSGNYRELDKALMYTGAFRVLKVWMNYEYLWINIRVKGGAYGCSAMFSRGGNVQFSTYRDPKLKESSQVLLDTANAVAKLTLSERDLTKYIIGAVNELDTPLTPSGKGARSLAAYISGTTYAELQKERDEVLAVTQEQLQELAKKVECAMKQNYFCVVGNSTQIEADRELFGEVVQLFH